MIHTQDLSLVNTRLPFEPKQETPAEWEPHFWKYASTLDFDLPKPCMYRGQPYWRGGLYLNTVPNTGFEWVSDFRSGMWLVPTSELIAPTMLEYVKWFKQAIENYEYIIKENRNGLGVVRNPKAYQHKKRVRRAG